MKVFFPILLFISLTGAAKTDSSSVKSNLVFEYAAYRGKITQIFPTFPQRDAALIQELNISFQTRGKQQWHQSYHFPQVGVAFLFGYLGNNEVFGHNVGLVPNLTFNSTRSTKWGTQLNAGMGFAWFDKPFDPITNPENNLIGSSITNMSFVKLNLWAKLSPTLTLKGGVAAIHCSNGHYTLPNLGINLPSVSLGLKYYPSLKKTLYRRDTLVLPSNKVLFTAMLGLGRHEFGSSTKPTGGPKYMIYQGAFYFSKRFRYVSNVHAGMFLNYYSGYYDYTVNHEVFPKHRQLKAMVATAFLGHEFMIGRVGLVAQAGINVYNPFFKEFKKIEQAKASFELFSKTYIVNKLGIQYYFSDPTQTTQRRLFAGIFIKANFGQADFAEVAAGYTF